MYLENRDILLQAISLQKELSVLAEWDADILNMKVHDCLLSVMLIRHHLEQAIAQAGGNMTGYHDFRELLAGLILI